MACDVDPLDVARTSPLRSRKTIEECLESEFPEVKTTIAMIGTRRER